MSKLELTSLNCTNCGASLTGYEGKNEIQCEYCNTTLKVLRPKSVSVTQGNLSTDSYDRLNNYVEILQKAIRAGNFNEGYDYCNKALEVNPNIGSIWENKAICAFWRSVSFLNEDKITISNAREIRTFLSASQENDPNSETYEITADAIGSNLATILRIKLAKISPVGPIIVVSGVKMPSYTTKGISHAKDYLETLETAYDIMVNKDLDILKYLVSEFSNHGKLIWWEAKKAYGEAEDPTNIKPTAFAKSVGFDVESKRNSLIRRIHNVDETYEAPIIKVVVEPRWPIYIIIAIGIFFIFLMWLNGK
jgi:DNA-directed RNA polymerase subunit RPC12/RpoP